MSERWSQRDQPLQLARVATFRAASTALMRAVYVPDRSGLPDIRPVVGSIVTPPGLMGTVVALPWQVIRTS